MKTDLTGYLLYCVLSVGLLLHSNLNAQDKPTHLTFSYIDHPVIVNEIIPIVQRAYLELGIQTKLVMLPSSRNLKAVEAGEVDGDIAFSGLLLKNHQTLLKIEAELGTSIFALLCLHDVQCDQGVLFKKNSVIVSTDKAYEGLLRFYSQPLSDAFYTINNLSTIPKLLTHKRFQYGIYVLGESQVMGSEFQHVKIIELFKTKTYHTIAQKYGFMKDEITAALQRSIDQAKK